MWRPIHLGSFSLCVVLLSGGLKNQFTLVNLDINPPRLVVLFFVSLEIIANVKYILNYDLYIYSKGHKWLTLVFINSYVH